MSSELVSSGASSPEQAAKPSGVSDRTRGYAFGIFAVVTVSPDALLVRLPSAAEDPLLVTAVRCAWVCGLCVLTCLVQHRGVRRLLARVRADLRPLLLVSACATLTSLGFPLALQLTGSAEALLLISLNPLWAALIGWRFLGDALPLRTKLAVGGAMLSIALIFVPSLVGDADDGEHSSTRLAGALVAVGTGFGLAGFGNAVRYARKRHPDMPTHFAQVISNANATACCLLIMAASGRPLALREPGRVGWATCLMGVMINAAYLGFNRAPKYIPAAEFGVICLAEAVLGPLWVFIFLGERPSSWTLVGGALLLATLALHEVAQSDCTRARRRTRLVVEPPAPACDPSTRAV